MGSTIVSHLYRTVHVESGVRRYGVDSDGVGLISIVFYVLISAQICEVGEGTAEGSDSEFVGSHDFVVAVVVSSGSIGVDVDEVSGVVFTVTDGDRSGDGHSRDGSCKCPSQPHSSLAVFSQIELVASK